jgi:hypothetical protein
VGKVVSLATVTLLGQEALNAIWYVHGEGLKGKREREDYSILQKMYSCFPSAVPWPVRVQTWVRWKTMRSMSNGSLGKS